MKIKLSPQRRNDTLTVEVIDANQIKVNGELFDFTQIAEGDTLPADAIGNEFFSGPVERTGGELVMTLTLPHGPNPSQAVSFPEVINFTGTGVVQLPE